MSKLTLEIPDELHQAIKSFAYSHGITIREFFIQATLEGLKRMSGSSLKNKKKSDIRAAKKKIDKVVKSRVGRLVSAAHRANFKKLKTKTV